VENGGLVTTASSKQLPEDFTLDLGSNILPEEFSLDDLQNLPSEFILDKIEDIKKDDVFILDAPEVFILDSENDEDPEVFILDQETQKL